MRCPVNRRKMLTEGLKTLGQSLPRMLEILAGAGLHYSSLGKRKGKEMEVDLGEVPAPPLEKPKKQRVPLRRISS
jgi:hypothetical protein